MIDLYLQDQILKGRYLPGQTILDAGAGSGRNLAWFLDQGLNVTACDVQSDCHEIVRQRYPEARFNWVTSDLDSLPFDPHSFDHVICNAVLHFARSEDHFDRMWSGLLRVLKPGGSLFVRTCGAMGIEERLIALGDGRYSLPDGTERFLITRSKMGALREDPSVRLLEPVKWVNVDDLRVMMTWVLEKEEH